MIPIEIEVARDHIDNRNPQDLTTCPVAPAMAEQIPHERKPHGAGDAP